MHEPGYADIIVALDHYYDIEEWLLHQHQSVEIITMKNYFGCQEIILDVEWDVFLNIYDDYFREDYKQACLDALVGLMMKPNEENKPKVPT